jgi:hypothetical protein
MKHQPKKQRNLELVELDKDLARIVRDYCDRHKVKMYAATSELVRIGLRMKRLIPPSGEGL